jgi:predicted benzoate:H+ symporter BenE
MLSPQNDSNVAGRRTKSAGLFVVHGVIVGALVALALISRGSSALISETAQAEFVSPALHSAAAIQIAQPAVQEWTARTN